MKSEKALAILMHGLGLFYGFVPALIIWLLKKDESAFIDSHGKQSMNFYISTCIYFIVSGILCIIMIGFILLAIVTVFYYVVLIIAIVKAANGEEYNFPLTIPFLK